MSGRKCILCIVLLTAVISLLLPLAGCGESAEISGRVRNKGAWPISGLTMYVKFLDENGKVLTTGSCETVLDSPAKENDTAGYTIQIRNFYNYDSIVSVTVEFGK